MGSDKHILDLPVEKYREPEHETFPLTYRRWSPRAMTGEAVTDEELSRLFEAARWAPSSYNGQPWRFVYAKRDTPYWQEFFSLLGEFNRKWAESAGALILILSRRIFEHSGKPARTHSFDTGAAWQNLALQGRRMELVVHGMAGFDYDEAAALLDLPDHYAVEAMVAVGRPAPVETLADDLRKKEKPSDRKSVDEIAFEGRLPVK